jgi:hypothetical protein
MNPDPVSSADRFTYRILSVSDPYTGWILSCLNSVLPVIFVDDNDNNSLLIL